MSDDIKLLVKPEQPSIAKKYFLHVAEGVGVGVASVVLLATLIINGLSASPDHQNFGFRNQTGAVSDTFYTQITPDGWAFAIWAIIYTWQVIWMAYGWSFVFRPSFTKTINPLVYVFYSLANVCNIIWIYLWGNELPQAAFPFIALIAFFNMCAIGVEVVHLYYQKPPTSIKLQKANKIEYFLSEFVVVNGITIYATWVSIATLLNFTIVIQYYGGLNAADSSTISLSLLTVELLVYFVLENVFLDRFLRYVFMVYPVVIWALSAIVSAHADDPDAERNLIFTIILLVLAIILFCVRIVLIVIFGLFRPIKKVFVSSIV
jgi:hypothetical protein